MGSGEYLISGGNETDVHSSSRPAAGTMQERFENYSSGSDASDEELARAAEEDEVPRGGNSLEYHKLKQQAIYMKAVSDQKYYEKLEKKG